jgi:two-component sensor histidine kinase
MILITQVRLENKPDGIILQVRDDGVGIPPGVDVQKTPGFGLTIVNMLGNTYIDRTLSPRVSV